jgi:hypothetical protein
VRKVAPLVAAVLIAVIGCRTATIKNVTNAPLAPAPDTKLTMEDVSKAIWTAGKRLGWVIQDVHPGELTGTLNRRKHVAVVTITHDTSTFSIDYKDSQNLMYRGQDIHRKYNLWVQRLAKAIQAEIGRRSVSQ